MAVIGLDHLSKLQLPVKQIYAQTRSDSAIKILQFLGMKCCNETGGFSRNDMPNTAELMEELNIKSLSLSNLSN